jgi:outer membrane protein TolC
VLVLAAVVLAAPGAADGEQPASAPHAEAQTFAGAIRRALARHPSVVVAALEIQRADAIVRELRAAALPTLYGNATYTRLDGERTLGTGPDTPPRVVAGANQLAANATLTVPLIMPKSWVAWAHARESVDVSRLTAADVRRQVALATARAYLTVLTTKRVLEVNERARETAKAHYDYAHARRLGGVGNRIDEVRAAQELAAVESQVQSAAANVTRAREALGVLLGAERPVDTSDEPDLPAPPEFAAALDEAEQQRADLRAARARHQAAENVYRDSWTDFMPTLAGVFQPFYQNPASLVMPLTGWQATVSLSWPLYDGGLRYGLRRERAVLVLEARAQAEAALRQARADVRTAFEAARRAEAALAAAREAARLSRDALGLATLAYGAGATTNIEVIDAERRARDAETAAAIAEDAARQARIDLLASSGRFP